MHSDGDQDEWTPMEIDTLRSAIEDGLSVEEAAEILDRADRIDEVIKKCRELGLKPKKGGLKGGL
jgi:hypothetical protein